MTTSAAEVISAAISAVANVAPWWKADNLMQVEDFETLLRHGPRMPNFTLRTINSTFFTEHYADDLADADVALQHVKAH